LGLSVAKSSRRSSRILVNAAGTEGSLGLPTGLVLSMTLGTGTLGGTSTTDSVTYTHLLNIERVAYGTPPPSPLLEEEGSPVRPRGRACEP
jgi:acetaldehyde dehydrogenase (acetylating)